MHPYIPHLLSDIASAHRKEIPEEQDTEQSIEEHFEEIDRWVNGEITEYTFGYYCGLEADNFPPPEQLKEEEMRSVMDAFEKMMLTWNLMFDLPESLPTSFAYSLMVNSLNRETSIVNSGCIHLDFCSGYAPDCELKEYCPCLKIWNDEEDMNMEFNPDDNELPF